MTPATTPNGDARALTQGTAFTLLAAAGFASVSVLTSLLTARGIPLPTVLLWRYLIAAVVLTLWVGTHRYARIPSNEMLRFVVLGGGGQALVVFLALSSLAYIPAATLAFLFYTYPAWVALAQVVRGMERLDGRRAGALALSFGGIAVMVGVPTLLSGIALDWRGVALAVGAAILYGAYIPMMRTLQRDHPVAPTSAYSKIGAALAFLVLSVAQREFTWRLGADAWGILLVLAIVSTVLPSVFFLMGLVRLGPVRTAIISTIEPFLTAVLAAVALGQGMTPPTLVGGALIVSAVALLQFKRDRVA